MPGTRSGGLKAAATNKAKYGEDFYRNNGKKGGKLSRGGGFAYSHELAVEAGRKGGKISRRYGKTGHQKRTIERMARVKELQEQGYTLKRIKEELGMKRQAFGKLMKIIREEQDGTI